MMRLKRSSILSGPERIPHALPSQERYRRSLLESSHLPHDDWIPYTAGKAGHIEIILGLRL